MPITAQLEESGRERAGRNLDEWTVSWKTLLWLNMIHCTSKVGNLSQRNSHEFQGTLSISLVQTPDLKYVNS